MSILPRCICDPFDAMLGKYDPRCSRHLGMSPSKELKDDLRKLEATAREFAGIEADAARWRWLRAEHERSDPLAAVVWKQGGNRNGGEWVNTTSLDREVDSAIADMEVRCGRGCSCCTQCGDWYELHNRPKPKE